MISCTRSLIVIITLTLTIIFIYFGTQKSIEIPILKPLSTIDKKIGQWEYIEDVILKDKVLGMLGVDDYIQYVYQSHSNQQINLYVSYFSSLKEGKQFHSPKNCLVGSGSYVLRKETVSIPVKVGKKGTITVNAMIINNNGTKQFVLYWFQCRGRYIKSEYAEKIYRVLDSISYNRTDGAFIRIIGTQQNEEDILTPMIDFTRQLIPLLDSFIPGDRYSLLTKKN